MIDLINITFVGYVLESESSFDKISCYGSDEEQTKTTTVADGYVIHIEFCREMKERKISNNTHFYVVHP